MDRNTFSNIFLDLYYSTNTIKLKIKKIDLLEKALEDYLVSILGYKIRHNRAAHIREIKCYFQNIINNINFTKKTKIIDSIQEYQKYYKSLFEVNPLTNQFINSINLLYDINYNSNDLINKLTNTIEEDINITIEHKKTDDNIDKIVIKSYQENLLLPQKICINNVETFELILNEYINSIKNSDSNYNIFSKKYYDILNNQDKLRMLFQYTMYNVSNEDCKDIESYFKKYIQFLKNDLLEKLKKPTYICNLLDNKIYCMLKKSEIEYETPYYLSFVLGNKELELPNVKMGIENLKGKTVAHIFSIQQSPLYQSNKEISLLENQVKVLFHQDSYFKHYKAIHLISLILTLGILKGMDINEIQVKEFLPFRYKRIFTNQETNLQEIINLQKRYSNETMIKYMQVTNILDGISVIMDEKVNIKISDNITSDNKNILEIYEASLELGKKIIKTHK